MFEIFDLVTNSILEPIGIWIGLITTVPIFWTWYDVVWGRQRRHELVIRELLRQPGSKPAILIVDLLPGKEVRAAVTQFCAQEPELRGIPKERIFVLRHDTWLRPEDTPQLIKNLRETAAEILYSGADVVHYFHAGPVFAAAAIGAEFANASCRMMLYQNEQGNYINFGPLRHPGL